MNTALKILIACALFSGCGNRQTDAKLQSEKPRYTPKPLIIAMSGFATCRESAQHDGDLGPLGHSMFQRVFDLRDSINNSSGHEPDIMASCFTTEKNLITAASTNDWRLDEPKDEDYLNSLHHSMNDYTHVFVVGHSYGGWLAMRLVESWRGAPELIRTLHTIDPISKRLCFFDKPSDCLSAPKDINAAGRQHIKDHSGVWMNPWQKKTFFLHSSIIPQADGNPRFDLDHWDIDTHDEVWNDIKTRATL